MTIDEPNSRSAELPSSVCQIVTPSHTADWAEAIASVDDAARFLCADWTQLLHEVYGYKTNLVVLKAEGRVQAVLPFAVVKSPFTGTRAISLPFFDICRAYATDERFIPLLYKAFNAEGKKQAWDYLELRGDIRKLAITEPSLSFYNHIVDLSGGSDQVFNRMASSTRRAIRKAEKFNVHVEFSHSLEALEGFYKLQCLTRKRHGLPPQPFSFFKGVFKRFIETKRGVIVTAHSDGSIAASGIYLEQGSTVHYKYGASDTRYQGSRCNNSVMWAAMKHYSDQGFTSMDLGRNSLDNEGLRKYKQSWGSTERITYYHRYNLKTDQIMLMSDDVYGWHNKIFAILPRPLSQLAGKLLYKHIA